MDWLYWTTSPVWFPLRVVGFLIYMLGAAVIDVADHIHDWSLPGLRSRRAHRKGR